MIALGLGLELWLVLVFQVGVGFWDRVRFRIRGMVGDRVRVMFYD